MEKIGIVTALMATDPAFWRLDGRGLAVFLSELLRGEKMGIFGVPQSASGPPINLFIQEWNGIGFIVADISGYPIRTFLIEPGGSVVCSADDYERSCFCPAALGLDDILRPKIELGEPVVNLTGIIKAAPPRMNPHRSDPVPDLICDGLPGSFRELTEYFGASCRFRRLRPAAVPEHFHQRVLMLPASVRSKAQNLIRSALAYIGVLEANDIALGLCLQMDLAAAEKKVGPGDFLDLLLDLRVLVQQAKIRFRVSRPGQSQ